MRTGMSIYSLWNAMRQGRMTVEDAFRFMQGIGVEATEIVGFAVPLHKFETGPSSGQPYDPDLERKLVDYSARYGIPIASYCTGSDIGRQTGKDFEMWKIRLFREIDLAHRLGASLIRIDLVQVNPSRDSMGIDTYDRIFDQCVLAAQTLADYAKVWGITVTLENHGLLMNGGDRVVRLIRAVDRPNYGVTLDLGNTVCVDEDPLCAVQDLLPYTKEVHVKDMYIRKDPNVIGAVEGSGGPGVLGNGSWYKTRHERYLRGAIVGHGDLDMKELLGRIKTSGYDGDLMIEFEGMEDPQIGSEIGYRNLQRILSMV